MGLMIIVDFPFSYQLSAGSPSSKFFHNIFTFGVECHLFTLYSSNSALML